MRPRRLLKAETAPLKITHFSKKYNVSGVYSGIENVERNRKGCQLNFSVKKV